jgi:flagellar biosynthetic protein FliO
MLPGIKSFIHKPATLLAGLFSVPSFAQKSVSEASSTDISTLSNWPVVLLVLIGMIGFIFALAWFVKRFGGLNFSGSRDIRVISAIPVGTRERIALLDVKGQQFLIGVTTHQITHLHSFDEPVVSLASRETALKQSDFLHKLQSVMNPQKSVLNPQKTVMNPQKKKGATPQQAEPVQDNNTQTASRREDDAL